VDGPREKTSAQSRLGASTKAEAGPHRGPPSAPLDQLRAILPASETVPLKRTRERRPRRKDPMNDATLSPKSIAGRGEVEGWTEERMAILRGLMRALAGADIREEVRRAGKRPKRS
jgi:hypothetical protein